MNTKILSKDKDPMGAAILDYQKSGRAGRLRVLSSMFEEDEMPVKHLFRKVEEMPMLEQKALQLTKGRVLDIGAGSGCHTLALQEKGLEVKAIDISPLSCEAMELRGVKDAECINLFDEHLETGFDTILLLMNGWHCWENRKPPYPLQPSQGFAQQGRTDSYRFLRPQIYLRK